jgi:tRNA(Ile)-lysidine synthase TilS/MesJ
MKRCTHCILPETFPGIQLDENGLCQYCRRMPNPEQREEQRARLQTRFEELVSQVRAGDGYHCLMSWSGGKDSTYTLWLLREQYDLRVLAFTFDNGFVSPAAFENMRAVAENLGVDHVIVKPSFDTLQRVFVASAKPGMYPPRALERASGICNSCMALAKGIGLRMALEQEIPMLVYGWSPGQIPLASTIFRMNPRMLQSMTQAAMAPLEHAAGESLAVYFPSERHIEGTVTPLYNVSPLAFVDYDEETALQRIRPLGWRRPQDTDPNSTNCLLNAFANLVHLQQMEYHPYVMELAGLVREGYMAREEALAKLKAPVEDEIVAAVEAKLGISATQEAQAE